jgi:hypothetical protein
MSNVNTTQLIIDAREELKKQVESRDRTEKRIAELRILLRTLARLVSNDAERQQIMKEVEEAKRKNPSLMSAVADVLMQRTAKEEKEGLTANQIREILEQSGFDLEEYSQPLGAIMTALTRLIEQKKATRYQKQGVGVMFKWVLHDLYASGMRGNESPTIAKLSGKHRKE